MRKLRWSLIAYVLFDLLIGGTCAGFLPLTPLAAAQFTNVTGTVKDPNGVAYANGTIVPTLVISGSPTLGGLGYTPPTQPVGLDLNGKFLMRLADNTQLSPGGSQWSFLICSALGTVQPAGGKGPVCFTVAALTISGSSQDITTQISAVALALTGSSAGSGGNISNPASPVMAYYFTNACPTSNTGQCFFTAANTQTVNDCTWSNASATVTCASSHFVAADVGKRVAGYFKTDSFSSTFGCVAGRISFSSMTTGTLTISAFVSGTQITLSGNPSNTATGNNGCLIWGTPDDTNASAFETAYSAIASFCPKVMLAAAGYWFSSPHFFSQPTGCAALPSLVGASTTYGNMDYTAGFELEGRGPGNTVIFLGPDFPNGDACTHTTGGISTACFVVPPEGKWTDFQITGGAQLTCQVPNNKVLLGVGVGTLENIALTNFCNTTLNWVGIKADLLAQLYQVNSSGWGTVCFQNVANTGGDIQAFKLACENSPGVSATTGASLDIQSTPGFFPTFTCWGCIFSGAIGVGGGGNSVINIPTNSVVRLQGSLISNCEAGSGCTTGGTTMLRNSGGTVYLTDVDMVAQGGVTASVTAIGCGTNGGKTFLAHTSITNPAVNYFDNSASGCTITDLGANSPLFTGTTLLSGAVVADGRSQMFSCTGTANPSVTNSLYGTGPNVTATTCAGQTATLGTGIPFQQARTITGVICTSSATTVSVACTVMVNGSPASTTCTMTAATRCVNFTTTAVNPGDLLSAKIVTGAAETGANIKMQVLWQ